MTAILYDGGYPVHLIPHLNDKLAAVLVNTCRDEHGHVKARIKNTAAVSTSPWELFRDRWRGLGVADHHIRAEWRRLQEAEALAAKK